MFDQLDIISEYSRQDAIADGQFIDVTNTAQEAGINVPVAITVGVHSLCTPPKSNKIQSYQGRLWDVLMMFRFDAKNCNDDFLAFKVKIGRRIETLWATIDSDGITIMKPEEY